MVTITDAYVEAGDTVQLGDVQAVETAENTGSLHLVAAWEGEPTEYVVLRSYAADGDEIDLPDEAEVLAVTESSGMTKPSVWMIIPTEVYGE